MHWAKYKSTMRFAAPHVFLAAVLFVAGCFVGCRQGGEVPQSHYSSWAEAVEHGAVIRGWLPAFLPKSSVNIFELHDLDSNCGLFRFSCSPSDLKSFSAQLESVGTERLEAIAPRLTKPATFLPAALSDGRLGDIVRQEGYLVFERIIISPQPGVTRRWCFAMKLSDGVCYGWQNGP